MELHSSHTPSMDWSKDNLEREFQRFTQHCNYVFEGPLADKSEKVKCNYLMSFMGDKGRDIFETFQWAPEVPEIRNENGSVQVRRVPAENESLEVILRKFRTYVRPKKNAIRATVVFHRLAQQEYEKFDNFVTDLRRLVKDCDFGEPHVERCDCFAFIPSESQGEMSR